MRPFAPCNCNNYVNALFMYMGIVYIVYTGITALSYILYLAKFLFIIIVYSIIT